MEGPYHKDVAASPMALLYNDAPRYYQVEHFAIGLANPIDVEATKDFFANSIMLKLPRFASLLVKHNDGRQSWRPTRVNIDQHFCVTRHRPNLDEEEAEDAINAYVAELAWAPPMSTDKPLWEIHVLVDLRCLVLRVHHAIGDGTSMSTLIREIGTQNREKISNTKEVKKLWRPDRGVLGLLKYIWFSMVFIVHFMLKSCLIKDKKTVLNGKDYVHNWPQKLATASFSLQEVMLVKKAVPNATVDDVLCGIIWGGFLKYIKTHSSTELKEGQPITGMIMADMRPCTSFQDLGTLIEDNKLESFWGNKDAPFLFPAYYMKKLENPLDYVKKAKLILDRKKRSMEPLFTTMLTKLLLRGFGAKVVNCMAARSNNNLTFGFSNVVGPSEEISIASNPVQFLRVSISASHLRIFMDAMKYNNNLDLQVLVAEEVIPDPKFLATCFKDTLQEMKEVVHQLPKPVKID